MPNDCGALLSSVSIKTKVCFRRVTSTIADYTFTCSLPSVIVIDDADFLKFTTTASFERCSMNTLAMSLTFTVKFSSDPRGFF